MSQFGKLDYVRVLSGPFKGRVGTVTYRYEMWKDTYDVALVGVISGATYPFYSHEIEIVEEEKPAEGDASAAQ